MTVNGYVDGWGGTESGRYANVYSVTNVTHVAGCVKYLFFKVPGASGQKLQLQSIPTHKFDL